MWEASLQLIPHQIHEHKWKLCRQIPLENRTLNSSAKNTIGLTRSSEILVRTTGDIALEDFRGIPSGASEVYDGGGNLVLNGTDNSSTNAGDNFDLEGATGITF